MSDEQTNTAALAEPSTNGRNGNGQFAKGNKGGPGNPQAQSVSRLRAALLAAVTPEDIKQIAVKLIEKSKKGDVIATRELFDRLFGKSKEAIEVSGPNGGPMLSKQTFDHDGFAELHRMLYRQQQAQSRCNDAAGTNGN